MAWITSGISGCGLFLTASPIVRRVREIICKLPAATWGGVRSGGRLRRNRGSWFPTLRLKKAKDGAPAVVTEWGFRGAILLGVDLQIALKQARLILEQEKRAPTLGYTYSSDKWPINVYFSLHAQAGKNLPLTGIYALADMRKTRPREVWENPNLWKFGSRNYELLVLILNQLDSSQGEGLLRILVNEERQRPHHLGAGRSQFPSWGGDTSALPLLAEVCVRNGFFDNFLAELNSAEVPNGNVAVMLIQLEETLSLNFNVFTEGDLEAMPSKLGRLYEVAERQTWSERYTRGAHGAKEHNPHYRVGWSNLGNEIVSAIDALLIGCKKAQYLYVEGALRQSPNLEIESDKAKVESFLVELGFSKDMVGALNAAETEYKSTATVFELKSCFGHLRSFLEFLHRETADTIARVAGETVADKWGAVTFYLRGKGLFTTQHEAFAISLTH
jgi:hypothetical protein